MEDQNQNEICDVSWKTPFTAILSGPSKSGKSYFIWNLLRNADVMYDKGRPAYTIFYYASWQDTYDKLKASHLVDEWKNENPSMDYITKLAVEYEKKGGLQVVIDDMMNQADRNMEQLFTVNSHHLNISTIFVTQHLYVDNNAFRTMRINANYLVLFKNPASLSQAETFFRSFRRRHAAELTRVYEEMTQEPHTYMLIDLHQTTPEALRIRTKIFPDEIGVVYVPVFK